MMKKTFHILVIILLALNLTGGLALSNAGDCSMDCCRPADWADTGSPSLEAPSCCNTDGITCGFETDNFREVLDEALCCSYSSNLAKHFFNNLPTATNFSPPTRTSAHSFSLHSAAYPPAVPVYLLSTAILC